MSAASTTWLAVAIAREALAHARILRARTLLELAREARELAVRDFADAEKAALEYARALDAERPVDDMDRLTLQIVQALEGRDELEAAE